MAMSRLNRNLQDEGFCAVGSVWFLCFSFLFLSSFTADLYAATRVRSGLIVLYDFASTSGLIVKDRSGVGKPIDLKITNPDSVRRMEGSLEILEETLIRSPKPASRLNASIRISGEITIEAWLRPSNISQKGPARIVSLSQNGSQRNFTLGQDGDKYDVRLRTSKTSSNGIPSVSSGGKILTPELTHVVYTRDRTGRTRIYINGEMNVEKTVRGATTQWPGSYHLALANEHSKGRPWLGTYYLVALYGRDLLPNEVVQNYEVGPKVDKPINKVATQQSESNSDDVFVTHIAPMLARHCLECHNADSSKGKLDLSSKEAAFAGSKNGTVLAPGKSSESVFWEVVESDDMPDERPPLSSQEKKMLKEWIDSGADWTLEVIDPSDYDLDQKAGENWVQRLTVEEYIETVRSAVGVDIEKEAKEVLPADIRADGFSNTSYNLNVDLGHIEAFAKLAAIIVKQMDVETFASKFSKSRKFTDDDMGKLVSNMGKWLLRGPLEEHEVIVFRGISTTVAGAGGSFEEAVGLIIEAMLQSPRFLYRIENQRGDGTPWPIGDYEMASRLSYILWGGPPDQKLMAVADAGELYDRTAIGKQIRRMLKDPRARKRSARFVSEWLDLERLSNLDPSSDLFPNWDSRLADDMRDETLAFFEEVVWIQERPISDLLNAQVTFATARLASHYGLEVRGEGFERYDLSNVPSRGGILTQGSVLTVGGNEASMVTRGLFVLKDILRGKVKNPPADLDTTPVPTEPGFSHRRIAEARIADTSCGGCHSKFEPLAFGLEKFDGVGAYHEKDAHGNSLREDGEILFPNQQKPVSYDTAATLMNLLAESDRVRETITWKLTQFALGRPLVASDAPILDKIHKSAQKEGGTYVDLISAIVRSDLVQMTPTEKTF